MRTVIEHCVFNPVKTHFIGVVFDVHKDTHFDVGDLMQVMVENEVPDEAHITFERASAGPGEVHLGVTFTWVIHAGGKLDGCSPRYHAEHFKRDHEYAPF